MIWTSDNTQPMFFKEYSLTFECDDIEYYYVLNIVF